MFENLQDKLGRAFRLLSGKGRISEKNIEEAVKQVKLSLIAMISWLSLWELILLFQI